MSLLQSLSSPSTVAQDTLGMFPTALASHLEGSLLITSNLALAGRGPMTREPPPSTLSSLAARRLLLLLPAPTTLAGLRKCLANNSFVPTPCARTVLAWLSTQRLRPATFKWFCLFDLLQYLEVICLCFFAQQGWDIQTPPTKSGPPAGFSSGFLRPPAYIRGTTRNCWNQDGFRSRLHFVLSALILACWERKEKKKKNEEKKNISYRYDETIFLLAASEWKTSGTLRIDESWTSVFLPMNTESPLVGIDSI